MTEYNAKYKIKKLQAENRLLYKINCKSNNKKYCIQNHIKFLANCEKIKKLQSEV